VNTLKNICEILKRATIFCLEKNRIKPDMVAHLYNPRTQEIESRRSKIKKQPMLHN
jgi:hypothetical protein